MLLIDFAQGRIIEDEEIKAQLANADPYEEWLEAAQLDRVGAFAYENVAGAAARDLPGHVPEEVKQQRRERFMMTAARISRAKLKKKVGRTVDVLVDQVRGDGVALARSAADAPEIDGHVFVTPGGALKPGQMVKVRIDRTDAFDLYASPTDLRLRAPAGPPARMHRVISRV